MLVNEELFDASRQYRGKFLKQDLKDLQRDLLVSIAEWFHEIAKEVNPSDPDTPWLKTFRDRVIQEKAVIISFNWDLILDELIFGKKIDGSSYGFSENANKQPLLLKPHGSLNWFEEKQGQFIKDKKRKQIFTGEDSDSVYAFREFRAPVSRKDRVYTPLIVPPVYLKNFRKPVFVELWNNCTTMLSTAKNIVFLGYSMPATDLHAQLIMRCGFHNQLERELGKSGHRKTPRGAAKVIIVNPDRAAAQRIEAIAGPMHRCQWISTPIADWIENN